MRLRSVPLVLALSASTSASPALAQNRVIDEGTFVATKGGAPSFTESFKIMRNESGLITATARVTAGSQHMTSVLTTDTLGTPVGYDLRVDDKGVKRYEVKAAARGGRLTSHTSSPGGEEAMREYPLSAGRTLILDSGLLHQLYFVALAKRTGAFQLIEPRASRSGSMTVTARGLEPLTIGGRSVTGTHYSVSGGSVRFEFWVDSEGRLLRVDSPADGLSATRDELPR
jgi:hypothetical protein